ncbi:MAG: ribosomal protein S5 [Candidatus Dojkabacteria bacterium]
MEDGYNKNRNERKMYEKRTLPVRRVAKVTKGGKRLRFSTVVVVGDRAGTVGVALGRGADVKSAVEQGERLASKSVAKIELIGDTIPHEITQKFGAAQVLLRPARPGTGVIAGSSVRLVLEMAGIDNVYGKILGSPEANVNAYCTFKALKSLRKDRVLQKMSKMRERIHIKEESDKEKKIKEDKRRKESKKNQGDRRNKFQKKERRSAPKSNKVIAKR